MGRINLSGYGSSNPPSRERWEEMAEILYGDGSGKKDDRRVGTQRGRRRNRRPTLLNGGLTAQESLPASERTIDPSILYNTEDPDKPLPTSALGSGNPQMDWAMQQNLVNAPKGQSQQPAQQGKPNPNFTPNLLFDGATTVTQNRLSGKTIYAPNTYKSIRAIAAEKGVKIPSVFSTKDVGDILITIAFIETSIGEKLKTSSKGAKQLMQIVPGTATGIQNKSGLGLTSSQITTDIASNVRAARWLFFVDIWGRYKNIQNPNKRLEFAVVEYNASPTGMKKARQQAASHYGKSAANQIEKVVEFMSTESKEYLQFYRYVSNLVKKGQKVPGNFRDIVRKKMKKLKIL